MKTKSFSVILILLSLPLFILFSWPLAKYFKTGIPYSFSQTGVSKKLRFNDHLQTCAYLWELGESVKNKKNPLFHYHEFCFAKNDKCFPLQISGLIHRALGGFTYLITGNTAIGYNFLVFLSFLLTLICAFAFLNQVILDNKLVNALFSIIFAIVPFHLAQLYCGHWNAFTTFAIPLFYYSFLKFPKKPAYLLLGLYAALAVDIHTLYYIALFLPFIFLISWQKQRPKISIFLVYLLLLILPGIYNKMALSNQSTRFGQPRTFEEIGVYTPTVDDFLKRNNPLEQHIYLGLPLLALIGLVFLANFFLSSINKRKKTPTFISIIFLLAIFLSAAMMIGSRKNIFFDFFYRYLPFFNLSRTPARLFYIFYLALLAFASNEIKVLLGQIKAKFAKKLILFVILFFSFLTITDFKLINKNVGIDILPKLNFDLRGEKFLAVPLVENGHFIGSIYEYFFTQANGKLVNGYSPIAREEINKLIKETELLNYGNFTKKECQLLKKLKINNVVVFKDQLGFKEYLSDVNPEITLTKLRENQYLKLVASDTENQIYQFQLNFK